MKSELHLKQHLNRKKPCDAPANFVCDDCGRPFKTKRNLNEHKSVQHRQDAIKYGCIYCVEVLKTEKILRAHYRNVHKKSNVKKYNPIKL